MVGTWWQGQRRAWRTALVVVLAVALAFAVTATSEQGPDERPFAEVFALAAAQSGGSTSVYLKIPNVPGESLDDGHQNEIDVLSWSWGVARSGGGYTNTGTREVSAPSFQELSVQKMIDKASPLLFARVADGKEVGTVVLSVWQFVEAPVERVRFELGGTAVSSTSMSGADGEPGYESIALTYRTIKVTYWPIKQDGSQGPPVSAGWDLIKNAPL